MISLFIIILVISMMFVSVVFFYNIRKFYKNKIIIDFVLYILLISELMFFLIPSILRVLSDWQYERIVDVTAYEVAHVFMVEFFSFFIWLVTILVLSMTFKSGSIDKISLRPTLVMFREFKSDGREYYCSFISNKKSTNNIINFSLVVMLVNAAYLYNESIGAGPNLIPLLDWLIYPFTMKSGKLFILII